MRRWFARGALGGLWAVLLVGSLGWPLTVAGGAGRPSAAPRHYPRGTVVQLHRRVVHITIQDFVFHPASLAVSPGTTVIWTNKDSDPHTVDSATNLWSSEALDTDGQYHRVFRTAGTFRYYCSIHPFMRGLIIVAG
jgi:plastocyanin